MAQRRALVEGIKETAPVDPSLEESFVRHGEKGKPKPPASPTVGAPGPAVSGEGRSVASRVGLTTRIRSDLATALRRATLERKLAGVTPNAVQDILEAALEPWLKSNGYLN